MIKVEQFFESLQKNGINNFSGVPDSLLKNICAYITDNSDPQQHIITANEGSAIALAAGQYIASGKPSLVYMQNSGFGNALNPLLSLADKEVYSIPMLIMVGWRGEPGVKDEPQHIKQGAVMEDLLNACKLKYFVIDNSTNNIDVLLNKAVSEAISSKSPIVLLVKKGTFAPYKLKNTISNLTSIKREEAIEEILNSSKSDDVFVSTTGMPSRELFEIRKKRNDNHNRDFLTVGSMGHASMIALGIAQNLKSTVFCIDGDGASIMHLGNLTSTGQSSLSNYIHIILNNAAHDSVGGQPTSANEISLETIAKSCGYKSTISINDLNELSKNINNARNLPGPHLIEIKVSKGSRDDLGRPTSTPTENKNSLMEYLLKSK